MTTMAILIGAGGGFGTVVFRKAVDAATSAFAHIISTGGLGGASMLFLPALGGLAVGLWMHWIGPQGPGQGVAGIMEAVGMAAVLSGAVRAPITAIVLPFEMTNDYRVIVPLMTAATLSFLIASRFQPNSIYTQRLRKRGIDLRRVKDENLMRSIPVSEAMTPAKRMITVSESMPIKELASRLQKSGLHGSAVVDETGYLTGVVTAHDLDRAAAEGHVEGEVKDICTRNVVTAFPDESLEQALGHLGAQEVAQIPVVDRQDPRRLVGILRRANITAAFSRALADQANRRRHYERLRLEGISGAQFLEIELTDRDPPVGKEIKDLKLPSETVLISIRRGRRILIPHGNTVLLANDRILAATLPDQVEGLRHTLKG